MKHLKRSTSKNALHAATESIS